MILPHGAPFGKSRDSGEKTTATKTFPAIFGYFESFLAPEDLRIRISDVASI